LILPDSTNPYFAELGRGIEAAVFRQDYRIVLCDTEEEQRRERAYLDLLARRHVDGLLYVPVGDHVNTLDDLQHRSRPVVLVDREVAGIAVVGAELRAAPGPDDPCHMGATPK
jgi:LacI family transcriptional regulator